MASCGEGHYYIFVKTEILMPFFSFIYFVLVEKSQQKDEVAYFLIIE